MHNIVSIMEMLIIGAPVGIFAGLVAGLVSAAINTPEGQRAAETSDWLAAAVITGILAFLIMVGCVYANVIAAALKRWNRPR